ncbi:hypothetical protein TNCV_472471 [Trichonephila clavipes]|nr:hypothetical protein TNCV_472471 [Trichonephila clavipes]
MTDRSGRGAHLNIRTEDSMETGGKIPSDRLFFEEKFVYCLLKHSQEALCLELCPANQLAHLSRFRDQGSASYDVDFPLALQEGILM